MNNVACSEYKDYGALGYYAVHFDIYEPESQRNLLFPSSVLKKEAKRSSPRNNDGTYFQTTHSHIPDVHTPNIPVA
jgi:hypothetical protein